MYNSSLYLIGKTMINCSKHAYLIIAHGQFEILRNMISSIDDDRNDIFVHIDRKVVDIPELKVKRSALYLLTERLDVRWGIIVNFKWN